MDIVCSPSQIKKLEQFCGQLTAISIYISSYSTLNELGDPINNSVKVMTLTSNKLDTQKLQAMDKALAKENKRLEMKSEKMSNVIDSIGEYMDNEEEQEELYNQVLARAGVKIGEEMFRSNKESIKANQVNNESQKQMVGAGAREEDELDAILRSLKNSLSKIINF